MQDPTYDKNEIYSDPIWKAAFILSERFNDNAPLGWSNYIPYVDYAFSTAPMMQVKLEDGIVTKAYPLEENLQEAVGPEEAALFVKAYVIPEPQDA